MEIRVKVTTGVRKESVVVGNDGRFIVAVRMPREEGKANDRLCVLLAEHFGVRAADVRIIRGHQRSSKTVVIATL